MNSPTLTFHQALRTVILTVVLPLALSASADVQFRNSDILYVGRPATKQAIVKAYVGTPRTDVEISIPAQVSADGVQYDVVGIDQEAFQAQHRITRISIPATVTYIGDYAFRNCSHLTAIEVAADNESFCSEGGVLFNKNKAWLLAFPAGLHPNDAYTVPGSVRYIDKGAFYHATITGINLPANIESIGEEAFFGCSSLTSIDFPATLHELGDGAFGYCSSLTTLRLPDGLPTIPAKAFMHCDKVATLTLPQRLRTIGPNAFSQCEALPSVELPASLDSLAPGAFGDCKALTTVTIPEASNRFRSVGGILFDKSASTLLLYPAGRADSTYTVPEGIAEIGSQAFYTNRHITNVSLPQSLRRICREAFRFCYRLASMAVPNGVTAIDVGAFQECMNLSSVHLPENLTEIADRLLYITAIESLDIPTQVRRIGEYAFYLAPLRYVYIPDEVEEIGKNAFFDNAFLQGATIGAGVRKIGYACFAQTGLLRVDFRGSVLAEIGSLAFRACWHLKEMNLPKGVTTIGQDAFGGCIAMTKVVLPPSLRDIAAYGFADCHALRDIFSLSDTPPTLGKESFSMEQAAVRLYVPTRSENKYASASIWSGFTNRRGIGYLHLQAGSNQLETYTDSMTLLVPPPVQTTAPILSSHWVSDDPTIASIDSLGLMRGLTPGTTSVWHVTQDTAMNEQRTRCEVTVLPCDVEGIDADSPSLLPGDGVYTLSGLHMAADPDDTSALPSGIYIVRRRGKTQKLMINAPQRR